MDGSRTEYYALMVLIVVAVAAAVVIGLLPILVAPRIP